MPSKKKAEKTVAGGTKKGIDTDLDRKQDEEERATIVKVSEWLLAHRSQVNRC